MNRLCLLVSMIVISFTTLERQIAKVNGISYAVISESDAAVSWENSRNRVNFISILELVRIKGKTYKVTAIRCDAFSGCSSLLSVSILLINTNLATSNLL